MSQQYIIIWMEKGYLVRGWGQNEKWGKSISGSHKTLWDDEGRHQRWKKMDLCDLEVNKYDKNRGAKGYKMYTMQTVICLVHLSDHIQHLISFVCATL